MSEDDLRKIEQDAIAEVWGNDAAEQAKASAPADDDPKPKETDGDNDQPPADPEPDPWEGVSPKIKEQFEALQSRLSKLDALDTLGDRLKQAESRIGSITNKLHESSTKKLDEKETPTDAEVKAASESKAAWEALKEDFPEWAEAMDNRLAAERAELEKRFPKGMADKISALEQKIGGGGEEQYLKQQEDLVTLAHRDWRDVVKKDDFWTFVKTLPQHEQDKVGSKSAFDAIDVLDKYKSQRDGGESSKPSVSKQRKERLSHAAEPSTATRQRSRPTVPKRLEEMTPEEIEEDAKREVWPEFYK